MAETARNSQLMRLISLVRDLDRLGGADLYELAERHRVTTRTIRRDLAALRDAGMPVEEELVDKRKRVRVGFKSSIRQVSQLLDSGHYLALRLAVGQGGAVRASASAFAQLEDLAAKIESALGPAERAKLAAIEGCFHSYEKFAWTKAPADVLWPLVDAIAEKRLCKVAYTAAKAGGKVHNYTVLPLKVFAHDGATYLLCHYPRRDKVLTLNLHRLSALEVTRATGTVPPDFDPAQHERAAFGVTRGGPVEAWELRFSANVAPFIRERLWHPTQRIVEGEEGRLTLHFSCEGAVEVFAWVCSWHQEIEVITPVWAREDLRRLGLWFGKTYRE